MKKLLNDGWEFLKLPSGSTADDALDASGWEKVDLPHDWLIWQHRNLYESADAWYRRSLFLEEIPEVCMLYFDGVYMDCDILFNREIICSHAYGYTSFMADLSGKIRNEGNEILVHIRHQSPNSRWYSGSGIYRDVFLLEFPENHIVPDSFYLTEKKNGSDWEVTVMAETSGNGKEMFCCTVLDPSGNEKAIGMKECFGSRICITLSIKDAETWDTDHPFLYTLHYVYGTDEGDLRFGLREICFSPDHGFLLNGRRIKLKGACLHHDLGALGAAFHEKAARRQLLLMKEMGVNAIRTSHNPPASKLLDLCDELGILVDDEAFDMWERPKTEYDYARFFPSCEEEDVRSWIRRDRCHPCVIMWSIGNEIYDMHADMRGTEVCIRLMNQVRCHDPEGHAAVTFGCNYMPWEGGQRCAEAVKIAGYNYGEKLYQDHHGKHPDWVIYGSETASVLSSRGIYHFPIGNSIMSEADLQCSALGNSNTSWGATDLKKMIIEDLKCPFSMGQFIWSGIDYIGEPTPYHTRSCYFGQADTACFPKDSYFLFQSLWSNRKVLHIGVCWDWNPGQMIDVPVMTNYNRVELLVNGKSAGIRDVHREDAEACMPVWTIPFEKGELKAVALDSDGSILQEETRRTSADTARLILSSEEKTICSDGHDLAFITVQSADRNGNPVENARDRVRISVSGGAYLLGTDNGDSTDEDGYKQNCRRLFSGKLLVIIASNGMTEDAVVHVENTSGIQAVLRIPVTRTSRIPGNSCLQRIPDLHEDRKTPVRKIEIYTDDCRELTPQKTSCVFRWRQFPADAQGETPKWQVTNRNGIEAPYANAVQVGKKIIVTAQGDGEYYLRALGGNAKDHPEIISQIEFSVTGTGKQSLDPYAFISAGLHDLQDGEISAGNEKGVAFSDKGESMIGFSSVNFGKAGSDILILPIFALDGKPYEIELFDGDPRCNGHLLSVLHYEKPSIWNEYQEEIYHLPERLKDIHCLCFRMKEKVHMKGFRFIRQNRAFMLLNAGEADIIYGDSFRREGNAVYEIGNNVSLCFSEMNFEDIRKCKLMICGKSLLPVNTITIIFRNEQGEETREAVDFTAERQVHIFNVHVPGGCCTVTFVFLPGSHFNFEKFCFQC